MSSNWPISLLQPSNQSGGETGSVGIIEILRRQAGKMKDVPGGRPMTYEDALFLRKSVQGRCNQKLSSDFMTMAFCFNEEDGPFPYGLQVKRNGCRGIIVCVQAHILRHLIFKGRARADIQKDEVLRPGGNFRREGLMGALCEMIWRAGSEEKCCVAFPQSLEPFFSPSGEYRYDGLTERLNIYDFTSYEDLTTFMKKNMEFYECGSTSGCMLFVYSLVLSRGLDKVRADMGSSSSSLINSNEECSQALINLMIIGRAVFGVSNADELYDKTGKLLNPPKIGVHSRGSVGFLFWNKEEDELSRTEVGSKLKTPKHPIWVTHVNGNFGVLFSINPDLTRDWREEHRFDLLYYTGLNTQLAEVRLTVETRFGRKASFLKTKPGEPSKTPPRVPALEQCILTKWYEADVDWNGTMSFI